MAQPQQQADQVLRPGSIARAPEEFNLTKNFTNWAKQFRNYTELLNVPAKRIYRTLLSFMDTECFNLIEGLNK